MGYAPGGQFSCMESISFDKLALKKRKHIGVKILKLLKINVVKEAMVHIL